MYSYFISFFFFKTKGSSDGSDNSDVEYAYGTFSQRKVFGVNRATFPTEFLVVSILKMQFDLTSFWILSTAILVFFHYVHAQCSFLA